MQRIECQEINGLIWISTDEYRLKTAAFKPFQGGDAGSNPAGVTNPPSENQHVGCPSPRFIGVMALSLRFVRGLWRPIESHMMTRKHDRLANGGSARDGTQYRGQGYAQRLGPGRPAGLVLIRWAWTG